MVISHHIVVYRYRIADTRHLSWILAHTTNLRIAVNAKYLIVHFNTNHVTPTRERGVLDKFNILKSWIRNSDLNYFKGFPIFQNLIF